MTGNSWKIYLVTGLLLVGCGSKKQTPAETPAPDGAVQSAPAAPEELPAPEPAPAPSGIVLRARLTNPSALSQAVSDAASSPVGARELVEKFSPELQRLFERALDPEAPVEALVALHPVAGREPYGAWSISARGSRPVLAALDEAKIEFREGPSGVFYFSYSGGPCALGRSRGKSPARIVCADREESLEALVAYMLRGLPDEPLSDAAAHLEVIAAPLQAAYGAKVRQLRLIASVLARQMYRDNPDFDQAISELVGALAAELSDLAEDVERFEVDLWTRDPGLELSARLTQRGQKSWSAGALTAWSRQQAAAPEVFRRLPAELSAASYYRGLPPEKTNAIKQTLEQLVRGALVSEGVTSGSAGRFSKVATALLIAPRTTAWGSGPAVFESDGKLAVLKPAYRLLGTTRDAKELQRLLAELAQVTSSRDMQKFFAAQEMPLLFRQKAGGIPGVAGASLYEWKTPESFSELLGKAQALGGTETRDLSSVLSGGAGLLGVAPVGDFTWLVVGKTLAQVQEGFSALKSETGQKLGTQDQLAAWVETPAVHAGLFRLAWLLTAASPSLSPDMAKRVWGALADTPHKGQVPVTYALQVGVSGGIETVLSLRVPSEFLTDGFGLALLAGAVLP